MKRDATILTGYVNESGSGEGNWVSRIDPCPSCNQVHGAVTDIERAYRSADSAGDLEMERMFHRLWEVADDEEEREAVSRTLAVWWRTERREELAVTSSVTDAATTMRTNNDYWLGAWTPENSDGAA